MDKHKSCSVQHTCYHGSLKKKLVVIWKKINFKVSHVYNSVLFNMIWNCFIFCQFFLRTLKFFFVPWHVVIHHFRLLYTKLKEIHIYRIKNINNLTNMQMMLVLTIFEFFLDLRAWDCISHCRESIGCNMDHCYILMPLLLKYLLNHNMLNLYFTTI